MKKIVFILVLLILGSQILKSESYPLDNVLKPDSIFVSKDRVYITEGATIYMYSKNDIKYLGKFGKKGEGPGEINGSRRGNVSFSINTVGNDIFIHNRSKVMFFTKEGKFIREKRLSGGFIRGMLPVGSNFVARSFKIGSNRSRTESISIYDKSFKKKSEVAGKPEKKFERGRFFKIYFENNVFNMRTCKNEIFLNNTKEFLIDKYDSEGKKLNPIKINYNLIKVSSTQKSKIKSYYKNESRFSKFWERIRTMLDIADQYPAIKNFFVTGNKIYVQTYKKTPQGYEFYILDKHNGKILDKKIISIGILNIIKDSPYYIEGGKIYSLIENTDEEEWELVISKA